jgi:hypothetical protein
LIYVYYNIIILKILASIIEYMRLLKNVEAHLE